jgi:type I restriction enzyme S subunit
MSKKLKKNVPVLRFPEFEGDWENTVIENYVKEYKERVSSNTNLAIYTSSREGLKPQIEYFANRELSNENEYGVVPHGFFVYRHMSDDSTFKFNINDTDKKIAVSKEYPVFTTTENLSSQFLLYKLNYGNDFKKFAVTQEKGGTRTRLYFKNLCTWKTLIPSIAEQEKIASFLGTIDTRLTQLRRKRELLQTYKRGVMQKIFSQEVRFKGAIGADFPDWEKKDFGDIVSKVSSKYDPCIDEVSYPSVELESIASNEGKLIKVFNSKDQQSIKNKFKSQDVLFGKLRPYLRKFILASFDGVCSTEIWVLRSKKISSNYLYYLVQGSKFSKVSNITFGSKMPRSDWDFISTFPFEFPCKEEQEKIADFLTAIDRKIEAISRQIDRTEQFKKGLLQKMFV